MDLQLVRTTFSDESTIGELRVDGDPECFTLEDIVRAVKIAGITAIPAGDYEIVITFSERFGRPMPLLLKVPNFDGVRIHWGNTDKNTEGCILVGQTKDKNFVGGSRAAFNALFSKLDAASRVEKIVIAITNTPGQKSPDPSSTLGVARQVTTPEKRVRKAVTTKGAKEKVKVCMRCPARERRGR